MVNTLKYIHNILALAGTITLFSCQQTQIAPPPNQETIKHSTIANPELWPQMTSPITKDPATERKVEALISQMTIAQKVAQVIQPEIREFTLADMRKYGFGSYLNGGDSFPYNNRNASVADWVKFADELYDASVDSSEDGIAIPSMWGTDAVHGHNNIVGGTIFPHNIGLGAMRNPELIKKIGEVTALEVAVTGVDWVFAPTVAVARDDRWGRAYEAYSEEPSIVASYAPFMVEGMQGSGETFLDDAHIIATAKHFLGDGGTIEGIDRGDNIDSEAKFRDIHAAGYITALNAGVQTVMASFNSWHGKRMHGNKSLLTDVLKSRMGFEGPIVGDWNAHGFVAGCTNASCPQAFNAGLDIFMAANDWENLYHNTIAQVESGEIPMARLDDAVARVLRLKFRAGIFDKKPSERKYANQDSLLGSKAHRHVARQAVRESLVLLKNKSNTLPLSRQLNVLVTGSAANEISQIAGGWSITWQGTGTSNADFPGATTIYEGIRQAVEPSGGKTNYSANGQFTQRPDAAIVVFGETPYAEGQGDIEYIEFERKRKKSLGLLKEFQSQGIPTISIFITGRPLWVNKEINASDAFVVAWLPGSEGQGVADVLFKKSDGNVNFDFKGRLPFSWPKSDAQVKVNIGDRDYSPLYKFGYGLDYQSTDQLSEKLDENRQIIVEHKLKISKVGNKIVEPGFLFKGRTMEGATIALGDPANWRVPVKESFVSSVNGSVSAKAITWQDQDDARQITWTGKEGASAYITLPEPMSLAPYIEQAGVMSFDIRVDQAPSAEVALRMDCGWPCTGRVFIHEELRLFTPGQWQNMSVDILCLAQAGTDLGKVGTPFLFQTSGALQLTYANVQFELNKADKATISCTE